MDADFEQMARLEHAHGLYMDSRLGPVMPGENLEAAIYAGAKVSKEGKIAKSGVFVPEAAAIEYDGPRDVAGLWEDERFRIVTGVRVGTSRVMRTRPKFPEWAITMTIDVETSVASVEQVKRWLHAAGTQVGLGDWRPRYGRFTAEILSV